MRRTLALAAVLTLVAAGPGWADAAEPTLDKITIASAFLSKDATTQQTIAIVTIKNGNTSHLNSVLLDCTALGNDQQPEEVTTIIITNVAPGETAYGQTIFQNRIESGSRVSCRIAQAYK